MSKPVAERPAVDWRALGERAAAGRGADRGEALAVLAAPDEAILQVLDAAFRPRLRFCGRAVSLHVIENAKSGDCTEDCAFCSQSAAAATGAPVRPLEDVETILAGARRAGELGAVRYCIVASGRGPDPATVDRICEAARRIRAESPIAICASLGLVSSDEARRLAEAGVNRYNHNLETSAAHYARVCGTHGYADRLRTLANARAAGLELCCGGLVGMGETDADRVDLALAIREAGADSVPVNFLDPRPGTPLAGRPRLSPVACLRILCMFRLVLPEREIRIAGGREACLGALQPLALFAANSMFTEGYLTTGGQGIARDRALIEDAGFTVGAILA